MIVDNRVRIFDAIQVFIYVLFFYILNTFSPFITDDYFYSFIIEGDYWGDKVYSPINSVIDVIKSQVYAYTHQNGRFLIHCFVQAFCGVWGFNLFKICSAIVFGLLLVGIIRLLRFQGTVAISDFSVACLSIFMFIPVFGITFLGNISCSINYLWTSCAVIWWIYIYQKNQVCSKVRSCLLFFASILVGSLQESFSIGIATALGIYFILNYKELRGTRLYMVVGFWLGSVLVTFAPSNFIRFASEHNSSFSLVNVALTTVRVLCSLRAFWVMVLFLFISAIRDTSRTRVFLKDNLVVLLSIIVNILFTSIVAMNGKHQLVCIEMFSMLIILLGLRTFIASLSASSQFSVLLLTIIALVALYIPVYECRKELFNAHNILVERAKESTDGVVVAEDYVRLCMIENPIVEKYAWQNCYHTFNKRGLSLIITEGQCGNYIHTVLPETPENIVKICNSENQHSEGVYKPKGEDFYVVRLNPQVDSTYYVAMRPGRIGKLFAEIVLGEEDYSVRLECGVKDFNSFYEGGYQYVIVTDSSPIQGVSVNTAKH